MPLSEHEQELTAEREYIDFLYQKLDTETAAAGKELQYFLGDQSGAGFEARWEREIAVNQATARLQGLRAAGYGLCFGRIDHIDGERSYIGRIGLFNDDFDPLLTDWRAPIAKAFYCATGINTEGLRRRRHFHTDGRRVLEFHDDLLDESGDDLGSSTALLTALNAPREETMRDIVSTIQAEQDEIIRLPHSGVVVIEGGPGTGKTAVALHRVAYLLYVRRERLSRSGVLIVGPNPRFLSYIGEVLPALGETDVVFGTPGELFPGVEATEVDPAARIKGAARMAQLLVDAVADRQEVPHEDDPIEIELDDVTVEIDEELAGWARRRTRSRELPHNRARAHFRDDIIDGLVDRAVAKIGEGWLEDTDPVALSAGLRADVREELVGSRQLGRAVERLWPLLSPERLLKELWESPDRIEAVTAHLSDADRELLFREDGTAWTISDVPLLDEAAELLGDDGSAERHAKLEEQKRLEYAKGVMEILDTQLEEEYLRAQDVVDARVLAGRFEEKDQRALSERAAADRSWTYGHVVVDEAQELSEMDWRLIMRRCPSRSVTVVGDLAQRQAESGARTWGAMLDDFVPDRWTYRRLSVNYRTPSEIMRLAARVLSTVDSSLESPSSVRSTGVPPWIRHVPDVAAAVQQAVNELQGEVGPGTVAVIAPEGLELSVVDAAVLTPRASKGLEYDAVLVVEPGRMEPAELYVALTRATQRLGILHTDPLPGSLAN
ncbi:helicase [Pseudonocardiaceae bacterium YIM PH 21723]|nr:helicase [Pseudonocardiaceae bacterium YIM PH 21723]